MRLRPDLMLLPLDDEFVVFSEVAQCLIGLNASAAFVFHALQEGMAVSQLATAMASEGLAPLEDAERWVTKTLEEFGSHGMLADGPGPRALPMGTLEEEQSREDGRFTRVLPYTPFEPAAERRYRLLETCMLIRFAAPEQAEAVDAAIGHLAAEDGSAPTIVMDLPLTTDTGYWRSDIFLDGKPFRYVPRLSMLGPIVKASLWHAAVSRHDFLFYVHAGVVGTDKGCILLPAAPGSGKSSLTAALVHGGFRYFSDEVALIQRTTYRVPPVPLAICVKSTGWDLMARFYPNMSTLRVHGREDGKLVRYIAPPMVAAQHPPAPVSHIIFPHYDRDAPTELKPIARTEALRRLMDECLGLRERLDSENVEELLRWIAGIDCYDLRFSSLDQAAALVTQTSSTKKRNDSSWL
jgi:hypothetical protein